jgi:hypothetical protein
MCRHSEWTTRFPDLFVGLELIGPHGPGKTMLLFNPAIRECFPAARWSTRFSRQQYDRAHLPGCQRGDRSCYFFLPTFFSSSSITPFIASGASEPL